LELGPAELEISQLPELLSAEIALVVFHLGNSFDVKGSWKTEIIRVCLIRDLIGLIKRSGLE
jgi:hypothetical protein